MALRDRVEKLEITQGNSSTQEQIFTLPGIRISVKKNGVVFAIHRSEVVSATFVHTLLRERFPGVRGIILPCDHRHSPMCEELGCSPEERGEENYE
jgi:hypothetical protein